MAEKLRICEWCEKNKIEDRGNLPYDCYHACNKCALEKANTPNGAQMNHSVWAKKS